MGSGQEITLTVKGKADTAEIERLKTLMGELAPILAKAFDGVAPAAETAAGAMAKTKVEVEALGASLKNAFDGTKLASEASAAAKAIEQVGGVSKLTEKELASVRGTVDQAVEKFRALGRDVPPDIQRLASEIEGLGGRGGGGLEKAGQAATTLGEKIRAMAGGARESLRSVAESAADLGSKMATGVLAVGAGFAKLAGEAARYQSMMSSANSSLKANGETVDSYLKKMQEASLGMVKNEELLSKGTTAAMLIGKKTLDTAGGQMEVLPKMLKIAMASARATGQDVNFLFDSLVKGIGRASPMILDNLGMTVSIADATAKYGASIGKSVDEMSKQDKVAAVMHETLRQGDEMIKTYGISSGGVRTQIQQFAATVSNLRIEIGTAFVPVLGKLIEVASGFVPVIQGALPLFTSLFEVIGRIPTPILGAATAAIGLIGGMNAMKMVAGSLPGPLGAVANSLLGILGPFRLLIPAAVFLVTAYKSNFMGLRDTLQPIFAKIVEVVSSLKEAFFNLGDTDFGVLLDGTPLAAFASAFEVIEEAVRRVIPTLQALGAVALLAGEFLVGHKEILVGLVAGYAAWKAAMMVQAAIAGIQKGIAATTALMATQGGVMTLIRAKAMLMWTAIGGPIGLVVAAVALFAAAWAGNWLGIREHTATAIEFIKGLVGGLVERVLSVLEAAKAGFGIWVSYVQAIFSGDLAGAFDIFLGLVSSVFGEGAAGAIQGWVEMLLGWKDTVVGAFTGAYDAVMGAWTSVRDTVTGAVAGIVGAVQGWLQEHKGVVEGIIGILALLTIPIWAPIAILMAVRAAWDSNWGGIRDKVTEIKDSVVATVTGWWASMTSLFDGGAAEVETRTGSLASWLMSTWQAFTDFITSVTQSLWDFIVSAWEAIRSTVVGIVSGFLTWMASAWTSFYVWIVNLKNRLALAFTKAWSWIGSTVSGLIVGLATWISSAWSKVGAWLATFLNALGGAFSKAWAWISKTVASIVGPLIEWLAGAWHKVGQFLGSLWDTISEATARAWDGIRETFKSVAVPIINGMAGMFGRLAELARDGMQAAGEVIGGALGKISELFSTFFGALGLTDIAGKFSGIMAGVTDVLGGMGDKVAGLVSRIRGGIGDIASAFGNKLGGARERVAGMFGGGPGDLLGGGPKGGEGPGDAGISMDGEGLSMEGLAAGGGGGGGAGGKGPLEVGDSGADGMGEFYIGDDGSKVYTSGAGLARQDAKERARNEKEAARAAKAQGGKAKGGGADASAEKKSEAERASSLAKEMSDVAIKVAAAVEAGLNAMSDLRDADMPGRDVWEPRLIALQEFVGAAISRFQELGKGLLTSVGKAEDGTQLLDEANATMASSAAEVGGTMIDTIAKTSTFLQSLVKAKFPEKEKIDAVFTLASDLLGSVQDRAVELGKRIGGDLNDKGENPAAKALLVAGQATGVWVDLTLKLAEGAANLGARAKDLAGAPAALGAVQGFLVQIAAMGQGMTDALRAAVPDELERDDILSLNKMYASTQGAWIDAVVKLGAGAEALRKLAHIPDVKPQVERFFAMVTAIGGAMVDGLKTAIPTVAARDYALDLSGAVANTMSAWIQPVALLAAAAMNLRRVTAIPEDVPKSVGKFWVAISAVAYELYKGMAALDVDEQLKALGVSQALSATLSASVNAVGQTATVMRSLVDLPPVPEGIVEKVRLLLVQTSAMLYTFLVGEGWNLLKDAKRTVEEFGVTQALVKTFEGAIGLVGQVATLGKVLVDIEPINQSDVSQALANAGLVRDLVFRSAEAYVAALEEAGVLWEDVTEKVTIYAGVLKETLGAFQTAATLKVGEVLPIDPNAVKLALANASTVEGLVRRMVNLWFASLDFLGLKAPEVAERMRIFAAYMKDVLGAASAAAGFAIGEIKLLDRDALSLALDNAQLAGAMVDRWAQAWLAGLAAAERKTADVLQSMKDYGTYVKEALGAVAAAAGFAIEEVEVLDPGLLQRAMENAGLAVGTFQVWADAWIAYIASQGRKVEDVIKEGADYAAFVKATFEAITAGASLLQDVPPLDVTLLARIMRNIDLAIGAFGEAAAAWAQKILNSKRDIATVALEGETYGSMVLSAVDALASVHGLFVDLAKTPPTRTQGDAVKALAGQIVAMVRELSDAYDLIEQESGSLERAAELAEAISPAADAVGKVLDALSLERLLKSPLVDTKMRSGFMAGVAARRMAYLGEQIAAGIRRTVKALIDGLEGVVVPVGIETGLERLASAYERILSVMERVAEISAPSPEKIREVAALAALMIAALQAEGAFPPGGAGGGLGGSEVIGDPGAGLPPPPAEEAPPLGATRGIPGGGGRAPVVPGPPGNPGAGGVNVTVELSQPIVLDTEVIGRAVETIISRKNLKTTTAPSGTG